jgi:predicted transcriptional regulator
MKMDREIEVLSKLQDLMEGLNAEEKIRVVTWLVSKFRLGTTTLVLDAHQATPAQQNTAPASAPEKATRPAVEATPTKVAAFDNFEDLFRAIRPNSDSEKALASAVFLQQKRNVTEISSAQVQKELKLINERVSNITQAISALVKKKYIEQLSKQGDSQQARKQYKVTKEGLRTIENILQQN